MTGLSRALALSVSGNASVARRSKSDIVQGVVNIDKDIEAASLKALAAQSRLNSTLTSVYAKAPAQQADNRAEHTIAPKMASAISAQNGQTLNAPTPAPQSNTAAAVTAAAAKLSDTPVPGQQRVARQSRPVYQKQGAGDNETGSQITEMMPREAPEGLYIICIMR